MGSEVIVASSNSAGVPFPAFLPQTSGYVPVSPGLPCIQSPQVFQLGVGTHSTIHGLRGEPSFNPNSQALFHLRSLNVSNVRTSRCLPLNSSTMYSMICTVLSPSSSIHFQIHFPLTPFHHFRLALAPSSSTGLRLRREFQSSSSHSISTQDSSSTFVLSG
jgi:hypothetical protein